MEPVQTGKIRCDACGRTLLGYETAAIKTSDMAYRELCSRCLHAEAALPELDKFIFHPVAIVDCDGVPHVFDFDARHFGPGIAIDACELQEGKRRGYRFQVIGDRTADVLLLITELIQKVRRALSVKHLTQGSAGYQIDGECARGRIEFDPHSKDRMPMVVIDGKEVDWEQFGRMLMTFERWQFKLTLHDPSEEV